MKMTIETMIRREDGTAFPSLLTRPAVADALARYVHASARDVLWYGFKRLYGKPCAPPNEDSNDGPDWLDAITEGDESEEWAAEFALECALQAEIERRVQEALAQTGHENDAAQKPQLDNTIRTMTNTLRRHTRKARSLDRQGTRKALRGAGLLTDAE